MNGAAVSRESRFVKSFRQCRVGENDGVDVLIGEFGGDAYSGSGYKFRGIFSDDVGAEELAVLSSE